MTGLGIGIHTSGQFHHLYRMESSELWPSWLQMSSAAHHLPRLKVPKPNLPLLLGVLIRRCRCRPLRRPTASTCQVQIFPHPTSAATTPDPTLPCTDLHTKPVDVVARFLALLRVGTSAGVLLLLALGQLAREAGAVFFEGVLVAEGLVLVKRK